MRTKAGEKEKLKQEILKDSIQTFKKFGQAGAPVDQIMKKAGLTSGALYSHFKGKDDLFIQATQMDLDNLIVRYGELVSEKGTAGLKKIIDDYLSEAHAQHPEAGCLFASLSPDLNRAVGKKGKAEIEEKFNSILKIFGSVIPGSAEEKLLKARQLFTIMVGTMSIVRSLPVESAPEILKQARQQAYLTTSIKV